MKLILVRISAWIASIFYLVMSLVSLVIMFNEKVEFGIIISFFMFLLMSITGWNARKFGLVNYKTNRISKVLAIFTLIFGIFFLILIPILFTSLYEFNSTYAAIFTLFILFSPAVISAIALLFGRSITSIKITE